MGAIYSNVQLLRFSVMGDKYQQIMILCSGFIIIVESTNQYYISYLISSSSLFIISFTNFQTKLFNSIIEAA